MKAITLLSVLVLGATQVVQASPDCLAYGRPLSLNNEQVLHWKRTTRNQYQDRAHVEGTVTQMFSDKNGHHHFEIQIGRHDEDVLEIIYNEDFGPIPTPYEGMKVEACGDYITSTAPSGPYPASPDGAILHWVHFSPRPDRHPSGYLVMDGEVCGQDGHSGDIENRRPTHPTRRPKHRRPRPNSF